MAALMKDHNLSPVTALLLADSSYAPLNSAKWIERWVPLMALISVAAGKRRGRPDKVI
jgi:hypothetical protein